MRAAKLLELGEPLAGGRVNRTDARISSGLSQLPGAAATEISEECARADELSVGNRTLTQAIEDATGLLQNLEAVDTVSDVLSLTGHVKANLTDVCIDN